MNIIQAKKAFPVLHQAGITPLLIGQAGTGKSECVKQYAKENGYDLIELRLGQMADAGDLIGLADFLEEDGMKIATKFFQPHFLSNSGKYILFLDEINRATKDILQAVFELVYDRKISLNGFTLRDDCHIIAAMNPPTADYQTLDFQDEAFSDRFCHIKFEPTTNEWLNYAKSIDVCPSIVGFIGEQREMLEAKLDDFETNAKPSRRTWMTVDRVKSITGNTGLFQEILIGLVGLDPASSYITHLNKTEELIDPKKVLNEYSSVKERIILLSKGNNVRSDLIKLLCDNVTKEMHSFESMTRLQEENLVEFIMDIPKDAGYAFIFNLTENVESFRSTETDPKFGLAASDNNISDLAQKIEDYFLSELKMVADKKDEKVEK